jgi:hypothetical protein
MHAVWVAHRHNLQARVKSLEAGRRVRDHSLELVSEARQSCDAPIPGFPFRSSGWRALSAALEEADLQVVDLDQFSGKIVGLALLDGGLQYAGPTQELGSEFEFLVNFAGNHHISLSQQLAVK